MDKRLFKKYYGKVWFGIEFDKLIFKYILDNPKIKAQDLADTRIKKKRYYLSATDGKIASPTIAQKYIDIVKMEVNKK